MAFRVKVIAGPGVGSELELADGDSTIGRAPDNALVINDNNVSRVHARFRAAGNRIAVMDAGSRNGVYVNDRKLEGDELQPLGPGDRVVIGQSILELFSDNGGARPRAGTGAPRPAPRPNGGAPMTGTGAIVRSGGGPPPGKAAVPVNRGGTGAVAQRPTGAVQRPVSGGGPRVVNKKESQSAVSKPILFGIVGVAVLFALGTMVSNKPPTATTAEKTPLVPNTPVIPMLAAVSPIPDAEDKCNPKCQRELDIGDSQRDGGNLKAARDSFQRAVDFEPTCLSCAVRLEAVERMIEVKIKEYEKSGILYFEKGDFPRAIDMWDIAVEYIGEPGSIRDPSKKAQVEGRRRELKKKIEEAKKLIEKQPQ